MAVAHRVARRYLDQRTARQVVARLIWGMSRDRAKEVLKLPRSGDPSDAEIDAAYRKLIRDAIRLNPDVAKNQEALKELNIAKDTLRGQFDRKAPGTGPNAPEQGQGRPEYRRPPPPPRREEEPPRPPPPPPEGEPFAGAFHGLGNVDWKIATEGKRTSEPIYEPEWTKENFRAVYWLDTVDFILVGKTDTHWVFATLQRRTHSRKDYRDKTVLVRWAGTKVTQPLEKDLSKVGPKVIKGLREGAHGVAKFALIDVTLTEENIERQVRSSRLSFPDAVIGSGILGEGAAMPTGRKIQVEIEPVQSREKFKAVRAEGSSEWHRAYDWYVHINGKKTQLSEREVSALSKTLIFSFVFGYDYTKGKRNLTKLRGGRFKAGPRLALDELARALDAGATRDAVLKAAEAFPAE